jgi:hypothetical protein
MGPLRVAAALALVALVAACPPPPPNATRTAPPRPDTWRGPTRPDSDCRAEFPAPVDSGTPGLQRAAPTALVLPPAPVPREARGETFVVHILVAASGAVIGDSTRIEPSVPTVAFNEAYRRAIAKYRFHPALYQGCAVTSWYSMQVRF